MVVALYTGDHLALVEEPDFDPDHAPCREDETVRHLGAVHEQCGVVRTVALLGGGLVVAAGGEHQRGQQDAGGAESGSSHRGGSCRGFDISYRDRIEAPYARRAACRG
jgi:hypothetical protein